MRIEYSAHALERMFKRDISKWDVMSVIHSPDNVKDTFRGRTVYQKLVKDKILEIVTVQENDIITVITGYFLYS